MIKLHTVTLSPVGADGAAVIVHQLNLKPGIVRFLGVDYQNQPVTTDLIIKRDNASGATIFTNTSSATDIVAKPVGQPGIDEGGAATAATDGLSGGWAFESGLYFDVAEGDGQTSGNEKIVIRLWIER